MRTRIVGGAVRTLAVLAAVSVLPACGISSPVKSSHKIKIESEPPGATLYASGAELGATPLMISPGDAFPARFVAGPDGLVYRYAGTLTLKKPGCETYSTEVNDALLAKDVSITLDCDPSYQAPAAAPSSAPAPRAQPKTFAPRPEPAPAPSADPIEERLRRLEGLREKGVISEKEYREQRKRILEEL